MTSYQEWIEYENNLMAFAAPPHTRSDLEWLIHKASFYWAMDDNRWAQSDIWHKLAKFDSPHWCDELIAKLFRGDGPPARGMDSAAAFLDHPEAGLKTFLVAGSGATSRHLDKNEPEAESMGGRYRSALRKSANPRAQVALQVAQGHPGTPNNLLAESHQRYTYNLRLLIDPAYGGGVERSETFMQLRSETSCSMEEVIEAVLSLCPNPAEVSPLEQKAVEYLAWIKSPQVREHLIRRS